MWPIKVTDTFGEENLKKAQRNTQPAPVKPENKVWRTPVVSRLGLRATESGRTPMSMENSQHCSPSNCTVS